jgi:hypothetical protein
MGRRFNIFYKLNDVAGFAMDVPGPKTQRKGLGEKPSGGEQK